MDVTKPYKFIGFVVPALFPIALLIDFDLGLVVVFSLFFPPQASPSTLC